MAFIFVPNADGSFTEGDKQTNPDTGVEYLYQDGAWRALGPKIEDSFDTLDERYIKLNGRSDVGDAYTIKGPGETAGATSTFHQIKDGKQYLYHIDTPQDSNTEWVANVSYVKSKTDDKMSKQGTQTINTDHWKIIQPNQDGNNRTFVDIFDGEMKLYNVADPSDGADGWAANKKYVNDVVAEYLPLAGGNLTGDVETTGKLVLDHGTGNTASKKLHIIGETADGTNQDLFWSYKNADGTLDAVNYKGKIDNDFNLANKGYVDSAVASGGGGVPVGCIMVWMNSSAPAGWFKLQGSSFDINTYPQLHAYLQGTAGYTSGRLPNWSGHYPGEYGDHMATSLGTKVEARTGQPAGGAPRSSNSIPNGATRTFGATGNTNAYSAGASKVTIDENWDNTTRPKTVVVHYIIKHD